MKAIKVIRLVSEQKAKEICEWLDSTKEDHWEKTTIAGPDIDEADPSVRKGVRLIQNFLPPILVDELHSYIDSGLAVYRQKMIDSYPALGITGVPGTIANASTENLQILRYEPDDFYTWHIDELVTRTWEEEHFFTRFERQLSVVLYLNNDFGDGQTEFTSGMLIKPKPGEAIFFPSNHFYPHRARPVISGHKYALVTWINETRKIPLSLIKND